MPVTARTPPLQAPPPQRAGPCAPPCRSPAAAGLKARCRCESAAGGECYLPGFCPRSACVRVRCCPPTRTPPPGRPRRHRCAAFGPSAWARPHCAGAGRPWMCCCGPSRERPPPATSAAGGPPHRRQCSSRTASASTPGCGAETRWSWASATAPGRGQLRRRSQARWTRRAAQASPEAMASAPTEAPGPAPEQACGQGGGRRHRSACRRPRHGTLSSAQALSPSGGQGQPAAPARACGTVEGRQQNSSSAGRLPRPGAPSALVEVLWRGAAPLCRCPHCGAGAAGRPWVAAAAAAAASAVAQAPGLGRPSQSPGSGFGGQSALKAVAVWASPLRAAAPSTVGAARVGGSKAAHSAHRVVSTPRRSAFRHPLA